jgi:hypothetical protein
MSGRGRAAYGETGVIFSPCAFNVWPGGSKEAGCGVPELARCVLADQAHHHRAQAACLEIRRRWK